MRNRMNRKRALYGSTAIINPYRRIMRAEEGHGGGGGGEQQNNGGGNGGTPTPTAGSEQNNDGQGFDASGFWDEPQEPAANSGTPAPSPTPTPTQADPGQNLGKELSDGVAGLKFDDLFSDEIAEQINNGDLKGANERFNTLARDMVKQSVVMNAKVVQAFGKHLMSQVEGMIADKLGGEKNDAALVKDFPSAKNPAVYKTIKPIFDKSLQHTKGDRDAAIAMTRDMLKFVRESTGKDMGIEDSPGGRDNTDYESAGSKSLVESLLAM